MGEGRMEGGGNQAEGTVLYADLGGQATGEEMSRYESMIAAIRPGSAVRVIGMLLRALSKLQTLIWHRWFHCELA